jgi:hypothetical protein
MLTLFCRARLSFWFLLSGLALSAATTPTFPGQDEKWRYYQSPNFELYSGNSESESRDLLFKLEVLRAIFLDQLKLKERRPLPVTIYYFGNERSFRAYTPAAYKKNDVFTGYYIARPDRATIAMAPRDDDGAAQRTIFHEYIHHLMNVTEQKPPAWYNEGMAELFATIKIEWGQVEIGHPSAGRVYELQSGKLLPLEQLFATTHASATFTEGKHTGMFYSQAWALVHYCYLGASDLPRDKLNLFLKVARSPKFTDPAKVREICRELLGIDYPELTKRLGEYVRSGRYTYRKLPQPTVAAEKSYVMRAVPPEEIYLRLAELEARINRTGQATLALLHGIDRNPADPRPHEVLGLLARYDREESLAIERWTKAIELGTTNPAIYHELGQLEGRRWFSNTLNLSFRLADEEAAHLRRLLRHSIQCAPDQTAAYEMLAWVEATANESQIENINLVQKHIGDLTDKRRALLATALMLWRRDDNPRALQVLDTLAKMEPDAWVQWGAETLRAKIENRKPVRPATTGTKAPSMRVKVQKPKIEAPK